MSIRKIFIIFIGLSVTTYSYALASKDDFFKSKNYKVYLDTSKCLDTDIKCDVIYHSVNIQNQHKVTIQGTTFNIGPSQDFRGYIFYNGKYTYSLMPSDDVNAKDDVWVLEVNIRKKDGDHTILHEEGKWMKAN